MWAYIGRLAANSAAALTVGGSVLAIAIALGAVGLAETETPASPWDNVLVRTGFGIALVALSWIFGIFLFEMRASLKKDRFLEQLGVAIASGKAMSYVDGTTISDIPAWVHRCRALLQAGLGSGEGGAFVLKRGESTEEVSTDPYNYLTNGLSRLVAILDRPDLRVRFDFDHKRDWMAQASRPATSDSDET